MFSANAAGSLERIRDEVPFSAWCHQLIMAFACESQVADDLRSTCQIGTTLSELKMKDLLLDVWVDLLLLGRVNDVDIFRWRLF